MTHWLSNTTQPYQPSNIQSWNQMSGPTITEWNQRSVGCQTQISNDHKESPVNAQHQNHSQRRIFESKLDLAPDAPFSPVWSLSSLLRPFRESRHQYSSRLLGDIIAFPPPFLPPCSFIERPRLLFCRSWPSLGFLYLLQVSLTKDVFSAGECFNSALSLFLPMACSVQECNCQRKAESFCWPAMNWY